MSTEDLRPIVIDRFGGLISLLHSRDVPVGYALDAQDVMFYPGGVMGRSGTSNYFTVGFSTTVHVTGLHLYRDSFNADHLLIMTNQGYMRTQTAAPIANALPINSYLKAANLFRRSYWGFSDKGSPTTYPFYWAIDTDGTFGIPQEVAPPPPGKAVTAADDAAAGTVVAGLHKVVVWFETFSGAWTRVSPVASWTAAGAKKANITGIPIGPADYVKRRLLAFTAANGDSYFHIASAMVIDDNTATSVVVDFTDAALVAGTNVDYLFRQIILPPMAGVVSYSNRLAWWNERTMMQDWINIQFDGGFTSGIPNGWTSVVAGASAHTPLDLGDVGEAVRLTGDGVTATKPHIEQNAHTSAYGTRLIEANRAYRIRAKVKKSAGLSAGTLVIDLFGTGIDTTGLLVNATGGGNVATTSYQEFEAELTPAQSAIPVDLKLRVRGTSTMTSGEWFAVDQIEIKPSDAVDNNSVVRISRKNQPEGYDGVNGFLSVNRDDGLSVRTAFKIRDFLYFVKDRGVFVTEDNGSDDITSWSVEEVTTAVGTPSINGAAVGEEWAVIMDTSGLYYFSGSEFTLLSEEIHPLIWEECEWQHGHKFWVRVNTRAKLIFCGVAAGGSAEVNQLLVLDYREGFQDPLKNNGIGRKWAVWQIKATAGFAGDIGTDFHLSLFGMHSVGSNITVRKLDESVITDGGTAINAKYRTSFIPGANNRVRGLHGYLALDLSGFGTASIKAFQTGTLTKDLNPVTLNSNPRGDVERMLNFVEERTSYEVSTNATDSRFLLNRVTVWVSPALAPVRGRTP